MQVLKLPCKGHQDIHRVAHFGWTSLWLTQNFQDAMHRRMLRLSNWLGPPRLTGSQPSTGAGSRGSHKRRRRTSKLSKKLCSFDCWFQPKLEFTPHWQPESSESYRMCRHGTELSACDSLQWHLKNKFLHTFILTSDEVKSGPRRGTSAKHCTFTRIWPHGCSGKVFALHLTCGPEQQRGSKTVYWTKCKFEGHKFAHTGALHKFWWLQKPSSS